MFVQISRRLQRPSCQATLKATSLCEQILLLSASWCCMHRENLNTPLLFSCCFPHFLCSGCFPLTQQQFHWFTMHIIRTEESKTRIQRSCAAIGVEALPLHVPLVDFEMGSALPPLPSYLPALCRVACLALPFTFRSVFPAPTIIPPLLLG